MDSIKAGKFLVCRLFVFKFALNLYYILSMKKVCFVIPRSYYLFNPNAENAKNKVGGAQKQAYLLSTELAKNINFDVHFILADFAQPDFERIENVSLWKSFNFNDNILKRTRKLIKTLKKVNK